MMRSLCALFFTLALLIILTTDLSGSDHHIPPLSPALKDTLPAPKFSTFQGVVYKIPIKRLKGGYGKDILRLPIVDTIHWDRIDFPDSDVDETPFPGVDLKQGFGIIFTGTVQIPQSGWYRFATKSDDGSILWIDGQKVVDNDKDHRMRLRVDSVSLRAGTFPLRLWYYQAYPTRYGVQLDGRYYRGFHPAEQLLTKDTLVLDEKQLLFAHNSSELLTQAAQLIDSLGNQLKHQSVKRVTITGHTDNIGTSTYNTQLSKDRAQVVQIALQKHLDPKKVSFFISGQGETSPVAGNDTESGRAKNRRVVIEIEYY